MNDAGKIHSRPDPLRAKSLTTNENADLPTFFQHEPGGTGKRVTIVANLITLYGVLVAAF